MGFRELDSHALDHFYPWIDFDGTPYLLALGDRKICGLQGRTIQENRIREEVNPGSY